ncbi:MAG: hypothetical protein RL404_1757 [Pseudomonadota bacterium]|jgi:hypothetical protein
MTALRSASLLNPSSPRRLFFTVLILTTVLKAWLAAAIPFIGDEAYFYQWGTHVDWGGFYDHPPMVGWWLWALNHVSSHPLVLRLPAIALWIVITFGMMDLLPRLQAQAPERRWLLGSLFLLLPFSWAFNLITTDTPLIFFLFFSGYAFLRAELADLHQHNGSYRWYAAAGVLLGLALLSKYFAGLLAIAYAAYLLPRRGGIRRLLVVALCALPFMLLNLAWNSTHCWNNILFNLMNRNEGAHFSLVTVAIYVVMMVYLVTPWTGWQLLRSRGWREHWRLAALFAVPFGLFLLLSFWKSIGMHWVLAFLPFTYLLAGLQLGDEQLERARRWVLWLGLPHLLALAAIAYWPTDHLGHARLRAEMVIHREAPALVAALEKDLPADSVLMTNSYSSASLLAYHARHYVPVFGTGSFHARFDDNITNFRELDGKAIRVFSTKPIDAGTFAPYFDKADIREFTFDGATYYVADGTGFRFQPYYDKVIKAITANYYRVPSWLPLRGCRFLEQYALMPAAK